MCWQKPSVTMVPFKAYGVFGVLLRCEILVGENIVNVLQESRVVQLNKMLGLPPSALPPHDEVDIHETADLCNRQ